MATFYRIFPQGVRYSIPAYLDLADYELYTSPDSSSRDAHDVAAGRLAHGCGAMVGGIESLDAAFIKEQQRRY